MNKRVIVTDDNGNVIHEKGFPFDAHDLKEDQKYNNQKELERRKQERDKLYKDAMKGI